jgi:hypothetical protein
VNEQGDHGEDDRSVTHTLIPAVPPEGGRYVLPTS